MRSVLTVNLVDHEAICLLGSKLKLGIFQTIHVAKFLESVTVKLVVILALSDLVIEIKGGVLPRPDR